MWIVYQAYDSHKNVKPYFLWENKWKIRMLCASNCILHFNTYHAIGRFSRCHFETFYLFFLENRIWHFMQIVSSENRSWHFMQIV